MNETACQTARWIAALARKDLVLVAFDAEEKGDRASQWWLDRLENARRMRPWWKDANQMLQDGVDLLNDWILPAINRDEYLCGTCLDFGKETTAPYEYDGFMYCSEHRPHVRSA